MKRHLRKRLRGASLFIVMLVTVLLSGLGVFAARAASMTSQASGFARQSTQTAYAAELPAMLMPWMFGGPLQGANQKLYNRDRSLGALVEGATTNNCPVLYRNTPNPMGGLGLNRCWIGRETDFNKRLSDRQGPAGVLVTPIVEHAKIGGMISTQENPYKNDAGSLGPWLLDYSFEVAMGQPGPSPVLVAGSNEGGSGDGNTTSGPQRSTVVVRTIVRPRAAGNAVNVCGGVSDGYLASQALGYGVLEFNDATGKGM